VQVGQDVLIKTNVTGDKSYKGKVSYIAPKSEGAASSGSSSSSSSSTNVLFEVRVKIEEQDPVMKIGMNAFLNIILQSKEDVFSVPFDCVVSRNGQSSIYILDKSNKVTAVPVTTGLETETSVEISGDGLEEGMKVITKPSQVRVGEVVASSGGSGQESGVRTQGEAGERGGLRQAE
jgi:multidrug efflux pump subunit AcrA (membrane-fusion protein)